MNKNLIALAGLLAVCGFMTGCCKKKCETKTENRRHVGKRQVGKKKHSKKARRQEERRNGREARNK